MEQTPSVFALLAVAWIMIIGFAVMFQGPRGALRVNAWLLRLVRNAVGGFFVWLGRQIQAKKST